MKSKSINNSSYPSNPVVPKVGGTTPWGRWATLGGSEAEIGGWGAIGDPANNYTSIVLVTLSDHMS